MTAISISSAFDGGNIEVVDAASAAMVSLKIRPDPHTQQENKQFMQWFSFRSIASTVVNYEIVNAGSCSFAKAWEGSTICVTTDRKTWKRIPSTYVDGKLGFKYDHSDSTAQSGVYFAYFDLYSHERHLDLIARCAATPSARVRSLGQSLDGREIEVVEVGSGPLHAWAIHRQHPGESQAEFFAEGLLERLLGLKTSGAVDGLTKRLLAAFTFHVVPNMNPDGSLRGHLRTNAGGQNLNREWCDTGDYKAPTLQRSPEVFHVLAEMDRSGVDVFIDVHGDETLPFSFCAGAEGLTVWGPRLKALQGAFVASYERANPDMNAAFGYDPDEALQGNKAICSNQIAERFDCLAVTLEMPFKDCATAPTPQLPDHAPTAGCFNGERCAALGASFLDAVSHVAAQLRGIENPAFGDIDAYVVPTEDEAKVRAFVTASYGKK